MEALLSSSPVSSAPSESINAGIYKCLQAGITTHTLPAKFQSLIVIGPAHPQSLYVWNTLITPLITGESKQLKVYFCDSNNTFNGFTTIAHPTADTFTCTPLTFHTQYLSFVVIGIA